MSTSSLSQMDERFGTVGKTGPEVGGIRYCIGCQQEIGPNEHWLKAWSKDGEFAVGLHDLCFLRTGAMRRGPDYLCPVCGFLSEVQEAAISHMKEVHQVTSSEVAARLLK